MFQFDVLDTAQIFYEMARITIYQHFVNYSLKKNSHLSNRVPG